MHRALCVPALRPPEKACQCTWHGFWVSCLRGISLQAALSLAQPPLACAAYSPLTHDTPSCFACDIWQCQKVGRPPRHGRPLITTWKRVCFCARFAWAYQQLVDIRYEWAVKEDGRVNEPASSPVSDALFFFTGDLPSNASTGAPGSLQYYLAILEQNAVSSSSKKQFAGGSPIRTHTLH